MKSAEGVINSRGGGGGDCELAGGKNTCEGEGKLRVKILFWWFLLEGRNIRVLFDTEKKTTTFRRRKRVFHYGEVAGAPGEVVTTIYGCVSRP